MKTTKTKQVGFVWYGKGVITVSVLDLEAGVKSVDPSIKVQVDGWFIRWLYKGKQLSAQYAAGADVIYQVAGGTGAGVFWSQRLSSWEENEDESLGSGADRDQKAEVWIQFKIKSNLASFQAEESRRIWRKGLAKKTADL